MMVILVRAGSSLWRSAQEGGGADGSNPTLRAHQQHALWLIKARREREGREVMAWKGTLKPKTALVDEVIARS